MSEARRRPWRAGALAAGIALLLSAHDGGSGRGEAGAAGPGAGSRDDRPAAERPAGFPARIRSATFRRRASARAFGPAAALLESGALTAALDDALPDGTTPQAGLFPQNVQVNSGVAGTQSETSIAVFGSRVVVGYNQDNGNRGSGAAYSTDGGITFIDNGGLPPGSSLATLYGDPSVTVCGDGTFYYASLFFPNQIDSALAVNVGTFSGSTLGWTSPRVAVISTNDFLDKEWITCDRATNTLYLVYVRFVNYNLSGSTLPDQIEIVKSTDRGATWSAPYVLVTSTAEAFQLPYVAVGPNSEVYTVWERGLDDITAPDTRIEFRRSFNLGVTFEPLVVVRSMTPSFFPANVGYNRESTSELGTIAADTSAGPNRGNLYVIWAEREPGGGTERDVFVSRSTDQGATWSAPVRVNDDPPANDQVLPWLAVNGAGTVEAIWYDYRNWPGMHTFDLYAARSLDGGLTFGRNFRVSSGATSGFVSWTFIPNFGDYNQAVGEGTDFYPAWADGRTGDIEVFTSHIPTGTCGNGTLDPFEECDDGNALDGDSCSGSCALSPCGDGRLDAGEECDDGNIRGGDGCSETCRDERCGDFVVQPTNKEECDDGNLTPGDGCSPSCLIETDKMAWIALWHSWIVLRSVVTGRFQLIGDPGFHELGDLAFDPSGRLVGSTGFEDFVSLGFNGSLVSLAPLGLPGRGTFIGRSGALALTAIDFHPATGVLYGIWVDSLGTSRLITLDPGTGRILSVIGSLGLNSAGALAFDSAGTLYVSGEGSLYIVNPANAARTLVGRLSPLMQLSGMDFSPDGGLYGTTQFGTGADGALVLVNKSTAAVTILFNSGYFGQRGIRFAPPVALDHDLDGIHDIVDCAPADPTNSPPGFTSGLVFTDAAAGRFSWSPAAGAGLHNTYRGTIAGPSGGGSPGFVFNHACFEGGDAQGNGGLVSADPSIPPAGSVHYYLTDGESACGEGPLGEDALHPTPSLGACPTPP